MDLLVGKTIRSSEYGVTIDGALVTINGQPPDFYESNVITFADYADACQWAHDYEAHNPGHGIVGIAHRVVVRQPWAITTREL